MSLAAALLASGCFTSSSGVPAAGVDRPPPISRRLFPNEVFPSDLDLVVRLDLARLKEGMGPSPEKALASRASTDPLVSKALPSARTLMLGLRLADLEVGDRVIVVEGDLPDLGLEAAGFVEHASNNDKVRIFVRETVPERGDTDAVILLDGAGAAFVSPVETDAVLRVLRDGADPQRGQPVAEGLVSAELRPRRLPFEIIRKYPSISNLIAQVSRVRGVLSLRASGLRVDLEVSTASETSADKVGRFFLALKEGATEGGASSVLRTLEVERVGSTLQLRAPIPVELIAALLERGKEPPGTAP